MLGLIAGALLAVFLLPWGTVGISGLGEAAGAGVLISAWLLGSGRRWHPWELTWDAASWLVTCSWCGLKPRDAREAFGAPLQRVWPMRCSLRVPWSPGKSASRSSCQPRWRNPRRERGGGAGGASPASGSRSRRLNTGYNVGLGSAGVRVCWGLLRRPEPPREMGSFAVGSVARAPGPSFGRHLWERQPAPSQPRCSESRWRQLSLAAAASPGGIFSSYSI